MPRRLLPLAALLLCSASALAAAPTAQGPETPSPRPYPLNTCPVSGEELGTMGEPIVKIYDAREVRFCCKSCIKKFEANPDEYWAKVDAQIIAEQRMHYPLTTCMFSGEELDQNSDHPTVEFVHDNRLVRVCCNDCKEDFLADPLASAAQLDTQIADAQRDAYPLKTCAVGGSDLGSMGEPFELVFENRLVRLCCDGCLEDFHADPHKYMAILDTAYADAQRPTYPLTECPVSGMALGSMGEPAELVAGATLVRFCCDGCFGDFKATPAKFLAKLRPTDD